MHEQLSRHALTHKTCVVLHAKRILQKYFRYIREFDCQRALFA